MLDIKIIILLIIGEIIAYLLYIPYLKREKINQMIRKDGPQKHLKKAGTPTMGGVVFGIFILIGYLICLVSNGQSIITPYNLIIIVSIIGYGLLGFFDDYLIIIKKDNKGIRPTPKFLIQLLIGLVIYGCLIINGHNSDINFFGITVNLYFGYGIFIMFYFSAITNAVNLLDGVDGLAGGACIIILLGGIIFAYYKHNLPLIYLGSISIFCLLGFLLFNFHPAKIFMGNTGSMVLGGLLAGYFLLLEAEFLIIVMGGILLIETLSDILQVVYFKITKGKRIFKMAPFHHHLELSGYSELQIDLIFWSFTLVMALVGVIMGVRLF